MEADLEVGVQRKALLDWVFESLVEKEDWEEKQCDHLGELEVLFHQEAGEIGFGMRKSHLGVDWADCPCVFKIIFSVTYEYNKKYCIKVIVE